MSALSARASRLSTYNARHARQRLAKSLRLSSKARLPCGPSSLRCRVGLMPPCGSGPDPTGLRGSSLRLISLSPCFNNKAWGPQASQTGLAKAMLFHVVTHYKKMKNYLAHGAEGCRFAVAGPNSVCQKPGGTRQEQAA